MRSIQEVLPQDIDLLKHTLALEMNEARLEIHLLLERVMNVNRAYLVAHPERTLSEAEELSYQILLGRRLSGEPIAYILGAREFFGMTLGVTPATLIPRPDTELLVELALERMTQQSTRVLDMGTGSGAIALAIAQQRPDSEVWAIDVSTAALAVARDNAKRLAITNVHFIESDWFSALAERRFDMIVSNPPYIAVDDVHLAQGDVRFEPMSALTSGADGLNDIRRILDEAAIHLEEHGCLLLEHGYDQAIAVRGLLQQHGYIDIFSAKDIAGIERVSGGRIERLPSSGGVSQV